jgi:hypothetical protein
MLAHRDNKHYEKWNLENMCRLLSHKFPNSHVWVVKPSAMHLKTFSSYKNFVESDTMGCPTHSEGQGSWQHLSALISASAAKVENSNPDLPCRVIGFSKGCVVLNQLLYDLDPSNSFVKRVSDMYWLDGGHNGGFNTWVTDPKILEKLLQTSIHVHAHVTPYQMNDSNRKWIGKEQKKFVSVLRRLNAQVSSALHFEGEERSLHIHFQVLNEF